MLNLEKPRSLLIADTDYHFLESLKNDPINRQYPIKTALSGGDAQAIISDRENLLMGIFVSPTVEKPGWISVIKCAHTNRPATPIFLIQNDKTSYSQLTDIDIQKLGVKGTVEKPITYEEIVKLVAPIALSFDAKAALEQAKKNSKDTIGAEASGSDADFIPIRAEDFISGTKSFFDVYVKLGTGRLIKLLQAGDGFTVDRLENYLKKGVTHFYIRKEVQDVYMNYCDHLATALLKHKTAPVEIKVSQTLNQGEEVMKHLQQNGVSEANIRYAAKFVSNVRELTSQLDTKKSDLLSGFMANVAAYEHGVGTSMLASILAKSLQIDSDNLVQMVGMAAMLHDVALTQMPEALWNEGESVMDTEQLNLFKTHPTVAAEGLKKLHGFHPGALQAIEQHHMRLGGKGFPARTGGTPVTRLSEIIGICDELNRLVSRCAQHKDLSIFIELDLHIFPFFTRPVVQAVKAAFYPIQYATKDVLTVTDIARKPKV